MAWRKTQAAPVDVSSFVSSHDPRVLAGRTHFEGLFGDLAKSRANWQRLAFLLAALLAVVTAAFIIQANRSRVVPYVVEVDKLGRAVAFGPAERLRTTDQRLLIAQLAQFIKDIRTVDPAPAAQQDLVRHAYAFVDPAAAAFLNTYFQQPEHDPRALGQQLTRVVEVQSVLQVPGTQTYKATWTETDIPVTANGIPRTLSWEGYFTTKVVPPNDAKRILDNPLGVYVTSLNWAPLVPTTSTAASPTVAPPPLPPTAAGVPEAGTTIPPSTLGGPTP